jgi:hypothetical protein
MLFITAVFLAVSVSAVTVAVLALISSASFCGLPLGLRVAAIRLVMGVTLTRFWLRVSAHAHQGGQVFSTDLHHKRRFGRGVDGHAEGARSALDAAIEDCSCSIGHGHKAVVRVGRACGSHTWQQKGGGRQGFIGGAAATTAPSQGE